MASNPNLSSLGEFGFISRISAATRPGAGVVTGIGDDAAVTALTPGMQLLTSTDMLLENVHFRCSWHDPYRLGRKSLAVSISDIAAMGGIPRWCLLSLGIPKDAALGFMDDFTRGFLDMAAEHNVSLIGGDTCRSGNGLVISVTIMGEQVPKRIIRRTGARPGDEIWVTGTLGDAALGLRLLEEGKLKDGFGQFITRLLDPTPRTEVGQFLAESGLVTSMIDISDGLLADFGHIAEQSGVGGQLNLAALPISSAFRAISEGFSQFPYHLALSGGEDYELAFTASPNNNEKITSLMKNSGIDATPVGIVSSLPGVTVLCPDGSSYIPPTPGFNHF
ncbi:thiamine-phosphate kinase [Pelotalea chapellei]|uniref:Thiamine-monophosphate kinase n=1 Tax=Pelotalea chapellei TaxID=44671 RepID=A0ABS5UA86_9BACT|nr:thiamine-phosphate kinase [Pelotalea chapellei]MBT1072582.1 thiamine-phosphate kinase [Pelotalea chapellei]